MASKTRTPYTGRLATPLPPKPTSPADSPERKQWQREVTERTKLLAEHYSIDLSAPNGWRDLAFALAVDWVRGFQLAGKRGAKKKIDKPAAVQARKALLSLVHKRIEDKADSDSAICKHLATTSREELPDFYRRRQKLSASTLRKDLALARKEAKADEKARASLTAALSASRFTPFSLGVFGGPFERKGAQLLRSTEPPSGLLNNEGQTTMRGKKPPP